MKLSTNVKYHKSQVSAAAWGKHMPGLLFDRKWLSKTLETQTPDMKIKVTTRHSRVPGWHANTLKHFFLNVFYLMFHDIL
jgi:hypothetical protein